VLLIRSGGSAPKTAVAAVRLKESIRMTDQDNTKSAMDRSRFRLIQTPQTFQVATHQNKHIKIKDDPSLTDDASVAERSRSQVNFIYLKEVTTILKLLPPRI
jgi:2-C-methyl-D-erythritol 4-phosphate cytidylyltransferase